MLCTAGQVVEWYHPWANLAPTLTQYMDEQDQVLVCGCGNSEMSVDMYDDGEMRLCLIYLRNVFGLLLYLRTYCCRVGAARQLSAVFGAGD